MSDTLAWRWASDHAIERARERYGLETTQDDWREAAISIMDTVAGKPRAMLLRRWPRQQELWLLHVRGVAVQAIWASDTASFVTVFPHYFPA